MNLVIIKYQRFKNKIMKGSPEIYIRFRRLTISLFAWIISGHVISLNGQDILSGSWTGIFANKYKIVLQFHSNPEGTTGGNIKMYQGLLEMQNDPLDSIRLNKHELYFKIPVKNTHFKGSVDNSGKKISGNFIFPDQTHHPVTVEKESILSQKTGPELIKHPFTREDLKQDLSILYNAILNNHPDPFRYTSTKNFQSLYTTLDDQINSNLTWFEFGLLAARLTSEIHCSHTGIRMPATWRQKVFEKNGVFPIRLFFDGGHAYSTTTVDSKNPSISAGDRIRSINNLSVAGIIDELKVLIPAEGKNKTTLFNELNRNFNAYFYYLDTSSQFNIQYERAGRIEEVILPALEIESLDPVDNNVVEDTNPKLDLIDGGKIGLLTFSTFAIGDLDSYINQMETFFSSLKPRQTKHLILDLRDNAGGHPIFAAQLLSYLTHQDFVYFKNDQVTEEFKPLYRPIPSNPNAFTGELFVLINGGSLSTTGHLIALLKHYTKAIFVGEEPGSTFRCNNKSFQITLPTTQLEVNIPTQVFETSHSGFDQSEPFPVDFAIKPKISDIILGHDLYKEFVLNKIRNE